jgi:hypothetical protein
MMSGRAIAIPTCWRFMAGPESVMYYERDKRPSVTAWTADRGGHTRRGDLVLLYGTKRLQRYAAIARVCCDPVQNAKARRLKRDRDYWTYLQVHPLAESVPRAAVEAQPFSQVEGSGLKAPRGGQANRIDPSAAEAVLEFLTRNDPAAHTRLESWLPGGKGRWPRRLDMDELAWADWAPPETRTQEELLLTRKIADRLVRTPAYRYLRTSDGVGRTVTARDDVGSRLSLEHRITDAAGLGKIDLLLVDEKASGPTLLLIEVKLRASLAPGRNPLPQIVRYRQALEEREEHRWAVKVCAVAEHFDPMVLDEARVHRIECRTSSPVRGNLSRPIH